MNEFSSKFLSKREIKGLSKIGDILIPKNDPFPSFSESGCISKVDTALKNLDPFDRNDLKLFLKVSAILPKFLVKIIVLLINRPFITLLRMGNLGIKGVVYSLYYSNSKGPEYKGKDVYDIIGYKIMSISLPK
ncbi:MAG: hypothetical protein HeimC3_21110 [Candidatus Heimdallarchaeota archaeon LC_3]|nr:MAG: hypothetical protein HeimC3_21110 [Candidatus Heimdallarchaeota archaeon LC_3]